MKTFETINKESQIQKRWSEQALKFLASPYAKLLSYRVKVQFKECDQIIEDCTCVLSFIPKSLHDFVYALRGEAQRKKGNYDAAIADCDEAIRLNPNNARAYACRGKVKGLIGDFMGAIADLKNSLELSANIYAQRAETKQKLRYYDDAIADYDKATRCSPNNGLIYALRGEAKLKRGNYKAAISDFDQAILLNVNNNEVYAWRGEAKGLMGDLKGASLDLDEAMQRQMTTLREITKKRLQESSEPIKKRPRFAERKDEFSFANANLSSPTFFSEKFTISLENYNEVTQLPPTELGLSTNPLDRDSDYELVGFVSDSELIGDNDTEDEKDLQLYMSRQTNYLFL